MKNHFLAYIVSFFLWGIIVFIIFFLWKPYWENNIWETSNIENVQKVPLPWEDICLWDNRDECLQKISDRLRFMNDITAMSHSIETNSWKTIATINFPAFSDRTKEEKSDIIRQIEESKTKILAIWFASRYEDFSPDIKSLLQEIPFNELQIRFYDEPYNLLEIFDAISWKKDPKMKLTLEFYNVNLPEYLRIFDYIYMTDKMIRRNNIDAPLASFSLWFYPLFDEFKWIDKIIFYPEHAKILKQVPTKQLNITGIHTTYTSGVHWVYEDEKWRILQFLQSGSMPNIFIDSIAQKQNWISTLTWF